MSTDEELEELQRNPFALARFLAEGAAEAQRDYGYLARFDRDSFAELDRLFDEHTRDGQAVAGGFFDPPDNPTPNIALVRVRMLGFYLGETMIRTMGGAWHSAETDDQKVLRTLEVRLPNGTVANPLGKVMKRFKNGAEDGIEGFAMVAMVMGGNQQGGSPLAGQPNS